jgi:hypothetical protein
MKLVDLHPKWVASGGGLDGDGKPAPIRNGCGVEFDCPCGSGERRYVPFAVALDGQPWDGGRGWQRTGDTFETLKLTPSIWFRSGCCNWHGFITAGEVQSC